MCTAFKIKHNDSYFGRNLDIDFSYNEKIIITPRNYEIQFKKLDPINNHFAIIGMGIITNDYPFYFDAANEYGLTFAGLNFPNNATYYNFKEDKINITPFELPLYLLSLYKTVDEVKKAFNNINLLDEAFLPSFPLAPLHFIISDKDKSIVVESMSDGIKVYDNPLEVLTNNPPFNEHLKNAINYDNLRTSNPYPLPLKDENVGMGAVGLPGDASSKSRFVKTVFLKKHLDLTDDENYNVKQVMHLLDNISMVKGSVLTKNDTLDYTVYSSIINMNKEIYYYKTYLNNKINAVSLKEKEDGTILKEFELVKNQINII